MDLRGEGGGSGLAWPFVSLAFWLGFPPAPLYLPPGRLPVFGSKALTEFLQKHNFDFIIRAHEIKADGIQTTPWLNRGPKLKV